MSAEIIKFPGLTVGGVPVVDVIAGIPLDLDEVLVIGQMADGQFYFAASTGDAGKAMLFLEMFKRRLCLGFDHLL